MIWMYEHQHANKFETDKKIHREIPTTNHNFMTWMHEHEYIMNMQIQKTYNGARKTKISLPKKQILNEVHHHQLGNGPRISIFDKLLKFLISYFNKMTKIAE